MRTGLIIGLLALSFLGIADSWYLAESASEGTELSCGIDVIDGCNIVAQSPYSHLLGVPLGAYGVVFYALVFMLAAAMLTLGHARIPPALLLITALGSFASLVFVLIQIFLIKALCVYCLASAGIAFASLGLSWRLQKVRGVSSAEVVHSLP